MKTIKAVWECKHWLSNNKTKLLPHNMAPRYIEREEWVPLSHEQQLQNAWEMRPNCPDCGYKMLLIT